ncbi:hypothetical protein ACOMHN_011855 [Nucella lapillus]
MLLTFHTHHSHREHTCEALTGAQMKSVSHCVHDPGGAPWPNRQTAIMEPPGQKPPHQPVVPHGLPALVSISNFATFRASSARRALTSSRGGHSVDGEVDWPKC